MSLVESLQVWKDAVDYYNNGDFPNALKKFTEMNDTSAKIMFNIGRIHMSLSELQESIQAFKQVIKKDEHLAVGHFMLGVVNLMCSRHADALINFNETDRKLREGKFIDYKQLGMRYKLFKCEVLLNRAVCLSRLGYIDRAIKDLLAALQCKVEPRHSVIDISLNNLKRGHRIEFVVMDAVFQPPKSKTANLEKRDYLGKAQVVVDTDNYETMVCPAELIKQNRLSSDVQGDLYRVLYDFTAQSSAEVSVKAGDVVDVTEKGHDGWFTMVTNDNDARKTGLVPEAYLDKIKVEEMNNNQTLTEREVLLSDLRKRETRTSLRRVKHPSKKPLPGPAPAANLGNAAVNNNRRSGGERAPSDSDEIYQNEVLPRRTFSGSANASPKLFSSKKARSVSELLNPALAPHFRSNSAENLLETSWPISGKKPPEPSNANGVNSESDGDDYEEMAKINAPPYANLDVITANENGKNLRKGPERPSPPPKGGVTLKTRGSPTAVPRVPRANTVLARGGSAFDPKQGLLGSTAIPKPTRTPPRPVASPKPVRNKTKVAAKEGRTQTVTVEFIVSTSLTVSPSTTTKEIQTAAKEAITRILPSSMWCEKDGKRIRLDDQKESNILDLVKDGKLNVWCSP